MSQYIWGLEAIFYLSIVVVVSTYEVETVLSKWNSMASGCYVMPTSWVLSYLSSHFVVICIFKAFCPLMLATDSLRRCHFSSRVEHWSSVFVQGPLTLSYQTANSKLDQHKQSDQDIDSACVLCIWSSARNLHKRAWINLARKHESKVHQISVVLLAEGKQEDYYYDLSMKGNQTNARGANCSHFTIYAFLALTYAV